MIGIITRNFIHVEETAFILLHKATHARIFLTNPYGSHKFANVHGSLQYATFYKRFKSCCMLLHIYLRFITSYYDVFTAILHNWLRAVTDNYEQLVGIVRAFYGLLRLYYRKLRFIEAFMR